LWYQAFDEKETIVIDVVDLVRPVLIANGFSEPVPRLFNKPDGDEVSFHTYASGDFYWMSLIIGDAVVMEGRARIAREVLGVMWAYGMIDWSYVKDHA
jgi:hypothetical protein